MKNKKAASFLDELYEQEFLANDSTESSAFLSSHPYKDTLKNPIIPEPAAGALLKDSYAHHRVVDQLDHQYEALPHHTIEDEREEADEEEEEDVPYSQAEKRRLAEIRRLATKLADLEALQVQKQEPKTPSLADIPLPAPDPHLPVGNPPQQEGFSQEILLPKRQEDESYQHLLPQEELFEPEAPLFPPVPELEGADFHDSLAALSSVSFLPAQSEAELVEHIPVQDLPAPLPTEESNEPVLEAQTESPSEQIAPPSVDVLDQQPTPRSTDEAPEDTLLQEAPERTFPTVDRLLLMGFAALCVLLGVWLYFDRNTSPQERPKTRPIVLTPLLQKYTTRTAPVPRPRPTAPSPEPLSAKPAPRLLIAPKDEDSHPQTDEPPLSFQRPIKILRCSTLKKRLQYSHQLVKKYQELLTKARSESSRIRRDMLRLKWSLWVVRYRDAMKRKGCVLSLAKIYKND